MSTVLSEKNGRLFLSSLLCDNSARLSQIKVMMWACN